MAKPFKAPALTTGERQSRLIRARRWREANRPTFDAMDRAWAFSDSPSRHPFPMKGAA